MTLNVTSEIKLVVYGKVTLKDLRDFVLACDALADDAVVNLLRYSNQRDGDSLTMTVRSPAL